MRRSRGAVIGFKRFKTAQKISACIPSPPLRDVSLSLVGVSRPICWHICPKCALCHAEWYWDCRGSNRSDHWARHVPWHSLCPASCRASEVCCPRSFVGRPITHHSSHKVWSGVPSATIRKFDVSATTPWMYLTPCQESFPLTDMSEDCLTINVIRPAGLNSTANLPVLVWIYGGSLITGGSSIYNPAVLVGQSTLMVCLRHANP